MIRDTKSMLQRLLGEVQNELTLYTIHSVREKVLVS